jgi:regulator of sigma E protease
MALSILVLIHEFGHFLFARIFKVKVDKFYLFFDWKFSLFKWKPKNSDTEYGIGWIPLGGYCKIAGMIDESMDTEQMNKPAEPWEYRSKPAWQRLLIIVGGVMFNLILAIFIYAMVLFTWGDYYTDTHAMKNGFVFNDLLTDYERISDHCSNIAVDIIEAGPEGTQAHEYHMAMDYRQDATFQEYYNDYKTKYAV